MIPMPPPNHEQTMESIVACGVPAANIRIAYVDELQSDVVSISNLGMADEAKFSCLRQAVHPFYVLEIEDADQRIAFHVFADREDRPRRKAEAVQWLHERGMLDLLPQYHPAKGAEHFARELEAACSIEVGSALETVGSSMLTFRRAFLQKSLGGSARDGISCLIQMIAASSAAEHDIRLVIIAQAAASDEIR